MVSGEAPGTARDPGLQPERTALAWSRTGLAVVAGSLLGGRLLAPHVGVAGLVLGAVGVALGVALLLAAPARERRHARREVPGQLRPGGGLLALVAAGAGLLGVVGVAVVVLSGGGGRP